MTEQEFGKQVWRPYDYIETEDGIKGRVTNVCFPTKSVRINIGEGLQEWFRCESITKHTSITGETEDAAIIEDLHNKLMAANQRNENLQLIKNQLEEKLNNNRIGELRKCINLLNGNLIPKKKTIERIEQALQRLDAVVSEMADIQE